MQLLFLVELILQMFSEVEDFNVGSKSAESLWWQLGDDSSFMVYLEKRDAFLYEVLTQNVIPAKERLEEGESHLQVLKDERAYVAAEFETAMAVIKTSQPELEAEIRGQSGSQSSYRATEERRRRFLQGTAKNKQRLLLYVLSAGLGVLNFVALAELMGLSIERLTPKTMVLLPLGLFFSMSVTTAVHVGFSTLVSVTRRHGAEKEMTGHRGLLGNHKLGVASLLILSDTLFSAVGLMLAIPPNMREELFWVIAIVAVSSLASIVNVLLAWSSALERVSIDATFKEFAVAQTTQIGELKPYIEIAFRAKDRVRTLESEIGLWVQQCESRKTEALQSYRSWFTLLKRMQRKDHLFELEAMLRERKAKRIEDRRNNRKLR